MWFALASTYTHPGRDVHDFTRAIDRLCKAHCSTRSTQWLGFAQARWRSPAAPCRRSVTRRIMSAGCPRKGGRECVQTGSRTTVDLGRTRCTRKDRSAARGCRREPGGHWARLARQQHTSALPSSSFPLGPGGPGSKFPCLNLIPHFFLRKKMIHFLI